MPKKTIKKDQKKSAKPVKKKLKLAAAPTPKETPRHGFMWKVLERKQEQQKLKQSENTVASSVNPDDRAKSGFSQSGFGRFNGPRRRVG